MSLLTFEQCDDLINRAIKNRKLTEKILRLLIESIGTGVGSFIGFGLLVAGGCWINKCYTARHHQVENDPERQQEKTEDQKEHKEHRKPAMVSSDDDDECRRKNEMASGPRTISTYLPESEYAESCFSNYRPKLQQIDETNNTFKSSHKSSFAPSSSFIDSVKLYKENTEVINPTKGSYFLEEDLPNKAPVKTNKSDQEVKNQVREILSKQDAVANPDGVLGLSKEHLIFEIMQQFPVGSKVTYDDRRKNILRQIKKMKKSGEVIRCLNTGNFRIENKISQISSAENMNVFLNK